MPRGSRRGVRRWRLLPDIFSSAREKSAREPRGRWFPCMASFPRIRVPGCNTARLPAMLWF